MLHGVPAKVIHIEDRDVVFPKLIQQFSHLSHLKNFKFDINESSDTDSQSIPLGYRVIDQFRKIEACDDIRKWYENNKGIKYDIVVRARFDTLYTSTLNIPYHNMLEDKLYTEEGTMLGYPREAVIAGRADTMDKVFNRRYSQLDKLLNMEDPEICPHRSITHMCKINDVEIVTGFINAVIMRSDKLYHNQYKATVKISEEDINTQKMLYTSLFPNLSYVEDLNNCIFDVPEKRNIVIVTNAKRNLSQTLETLKSARAKIPNAWIILLEAFKVNVDEISGLYPYVDRYVLFHNDSEADIHTRQKSLGEVYKTYRVLRHLPMSNRLFKITGRYTLNDHFDIDNYLDDNHVCAQVFDNNTEETPSENHSYNITLNEKPSYRPKYCMNTTIYSIPPCLRITHLNAVISSLRYLQSNPYQDLEHALYAHLEKDIYHNIPRLGIQGTVGTNDELHDF